MKWFCDWLDHRTGYRHLVNEALEEPIPGGARWRYVWGSTLTFTFVLQMITGVLLWTAYSPSTQTAWESVYYIQHEMTWGWLIRGTHHFAAQAMVVLLAIHLMQVIIDGAYRAPREINFWLGLILAQIVLALSLTGYLLPWDQKGYYATQVTTKIVGATPVIGSQLQVLTQGGPEYGHHTLTRFFAMHAGVLPALLVAFLGLHLYVFRRHGITVPASSKGPAAAFWPDQVLRDAVACLGVLAVVMLLAVFKGAELSPPANPAEAFSAARPEWYFLFLFRFLRFEAIEHFGLAFGALYVPGFIATVIAVMPFIAYIRGGHRFNIGFMTALAVGIVGLTGLAMFEDSRDRDHQSAMAEASRDGHRTVELAQLPAKIPVSGAGSMLREDPFTQGPRLFAKHCAACHRFDGHNGRGQSVLEENPKTKELRQIPATAPDLGQFASREWWKAILTDFEKHFSSVSRTSYDLETSANEGMVSWARENSQAFKLLVNDKDLDALVEYFVAQSKHPHLTVNGDLVARGQEIVESGQLTEGTITSCTDCHASVGGEFVEGAANGGVPELNGYGSAAWLRAFIKNPGHEQFYGDKNQMTAFADKLSEHDLDLLVRYLVGDYAPTQLTDYPAIEQTANPPAGDASTGASDASTSNADSKKAENTSATKDEANKDQGE